MNAHIAQAPSLWDDIWPNTQLDNISYIPLNLTSISVGNGWINGRVQYRSWVDFACGGAAERGVPMLAKKEDCAWALDMVKQGENLIDRCTNLIEW
jgi:hypothetical protein